MHGFMVLPFFVPHDYTLGETGPEEAKEPGGTRSPPPDSDPFSEMELQKIELVSQDELQQPKMAFATVRQLY